MRQSLPKQAFFMFFVISSILSSAFLMGQNVNEKALRSSYPDEDVVFLEKKEHLDINYSNDAWDIERQINEQVYYLENTGARYGQKRIYYTSFEKITEIDAKTKVPVKNKRGKIVRYEEHPVKNTETKDVLEGSIFYSDHKHIDLLFPAIEKGATTYVEYKELTQNPYLLNSYYFSTYAPVLNSEFSVSFPEKNKNHL